MKNFGEFGKLEHFAKFLPIFTIFITFPMQMNFNLPKLFLQTSYIPYSPNLFTAKVFYCMVYNWYGCSCTRNYTKITGKEWTANSTLSQEDENHMELCKQNELKDGPSPNAEGSQGPIVTHTLSSLRAPQNCFKVWT